MDYPCLPDWKRRAAGPKSKEPDSPRRSHPAVRTWPDGVLDVDHRLCRQLQPLLRLKEDVHMPGQRAVDEVQVEQFFVVFAPRLGSLIR